MQYEMVKVPRSVVDRTICKEGGAAQTSIDAKLVIAVQDCKSAALLTILFAGRAELHRQL